MKENIEVLKNENKEYLILQKQYQLTRDNIYLQKMYLIINTVCKRYTLEYCSRKHIRLNEDTIHDVIQDVCNIIIEEYTRKPDMTFDNPAICIRYRWLKVMFSKNKKETDMFEKNIISIETITEEELYLHSIQM